VREKLLGKRAGLGPQQRIGERRGEYGGRVGEVQALVREEEAELREESNVGPGSRWGAESNESGGCWPEEHGWQSRTGHVGKGRRAMFCGAVGF